MVEKPESKSSNWMGSTVPRAAAPKPAGRVLMIFCAALCAVGAALFLYACYSDTSPLLGVILFVLGYGFTLFARQYTVPTYTDRARPPPDSGCILYLRPFRADHTVDVSTQLLGSFTPFILLGFLDARTLAQFWLRIRGIQSSEQLLAHALRRVGTVVAIGDPNDTIAPLGARRVYVEQTEAERAALECRQRALRAIPLKERLKFVPAIMKTRLFGEPGEDDPVLPGLDASRSTDAEVSEVESWKVAVRRLAEQAQLVVLHAGYSPALHWEADLLVRTVDPQRVLIFVNPSRPPRILRHVLFRSRAARAEKIATWMEFSKGCDGVFPRGLPRDANDCCFIRFDSEWNPISVKGIPSRMFGFTPIGKRSSDSTALDRALVWFAWLTTTESIAREASRRLLNYLLLLVVTGVLMFGLLRPLVFSR